MYNKRFLGDGNNNNVYCENGPNADFIQVILPVSHSPKHVLIFQKWPYDTYTASAHSESHIPF